MTVRPPDRYDRAGLPRLVAFGPEAAPLLAGGGLRVFLRAAGVTVAVTAGEGTCFGDGLRHELAVAATRDAVAVGHGFAEAAAAEANGVPFVHAGETAPGEGPVVAVARAPAELLERLRGRARVLRRLEGSLAGCGPIGVTGPAGVGKTLFAARLADLLGAGLLTTDTFLSGRAGPPPGGDHLAHAFDLEALQRALEGGPTPRVIEGIFLEDPRLRPRFDRIVHLRAEEAAVVHRVRARDGERGVKAVRDRYLPAWRTFGPHLTPDPGRLVVDLTRLLEPELVTGGPAPI